jgi:hypothetical protein
MEFSEQAVDVLMRLENGLKVDVLPKLIAITYLAVLESVFIIKAKGVVVDIAVVGEIIGETVIAPMAVTEKNKLRTIVERHRFGIFIGM